jgi:hypothetical protein
MTDVYVINTFAVIFNAATIELSSREQLLFGRSGMQKLGASFSKLHFCL